MTATSKSYYVVHFDGRLTEDGFKVFKGLVNSGEVLQGESKTSGPFDPSTEECICCAPATGFRRHIKGSEGCKHEN